MRELILSDITVMGPGYCVIGLERVAQTSCFSKSAAFPAQESLPAADLQKAQACATRFRSVRPMPRRVAAWPKTFPFSRGSVVRFVSAPTSSSPPHLEDQNTHGLAPAGEGVGEIELIDMLQRAEVSANVEGLFGCELHTDTQAGNAWVDPRFATGSICGCQFRNIRFRVFGDGGDVNFRAKLVLQSGETLNSLPVVDRDWRRFFDELVQGCSESRITSDPETFLNRSVRRELMRAPYGFARIGLARGRPNEGKCWLMLDSLFPQPNAVWLGGV
jgi:hypothetical protein